MTTLTDFLLARIAEDEAVARDDQCQDPWIELGPADGVYFVGSDDRGGTYLATSPARVLAECEAKRQLVELHAENSGIPGRYVLPCWVCSGEDYPCTTLRILATPYADRADFQPGWRL